MVSLGFWKKIKAGFFLVYGGVWQRETQTDLGNVRRERELGGGGAGDDDGDGAAPRGHGAP